MLSNWDSESVGGRGDLWIPVTPCTVLNVTEKKPEETLIVKGIICDFGYSQVTSKPNDMHRLGE